MNQYPDYTFYQNYTAQATPPVKPPKARLHIGIIAVAIALVFLLTSVAQILLHSVLLQVAPAVTENDWYIWALSVLPMYLFAMPVAYLILRLVPASKPQKQKTHPLMWVGFLCLCFALTYVANILGQYVSAWLFDLTGLKVENELEQMTVTTPFFINLLFVGILAPVFEELLYRKAVIDRLRRYGDLPAILISGLAFGLVHGNLDQFFYTTLIGFLLGYIYLHTGSVLYTISIHAAFNFIGGVYTTELIRRVGETLTPTEGDTVGWAMMVAYSLFSIVSLIVGVIFFIANIGKFCRSLKKGEHTLTLDQWMNVLLLNPGVWMFLAMIAILFVSSLLA